MDSELLVKENIDAGRKLVNALGEGGLDVSASGWFRDYYKDRWRFFLVTADATERSKSKALRNVFAALYRVAYEEIDLSDILVVAKETDDGKTLVRAMEDVASRRDLPGYARAISLKYITANEVYFYPRPELGSPRFAELKAQYPTTALFSIRVPKEGAETFEALKRAVEPFLDKVNACEFEGKPPETVLCVGPTAEDTASPGHLLFAHRPEGWNKLFSLHRKTWEDVVQASTGTKLNDSADFAPLAALANRTEALALAEMA